MKTISRIWFFGFSVCLIAAADISWPREKSKLQQIYDQHQGEILTSLSGRSQATSAYGAVFASGSARVLGEEDEEHAISVASLEAQSAVIDAFFEKVDWPSKIPTGLRQEIWRFYRTQSNQFSLSKVEIVDLIEGDGSVVVVIGVRDSNISFAAPSYRDMLGMLGAGRQSPLE